MRGPTGERDRGADGPPSDPTARLLIWRSPGVSFEGTRGRSCQGHLSLEISLALLWRHPTHPSTDANPFARPFTSMPPAIDT